MKRWLWSLACLLSLSLSLSALLLLVPTTASASAPVTIEVQATGDVRITPDTAVVWLGLQQEGAEASQALRDSYEIVEQLIAIFKDYAPHDRIKTSEFYLYRSERWDHQTNQSLPGPFVVRHVFEVPVQELERAAQMIDEAVAAGANIIQNIQYGVKDNTAAWEDAYSRALEQAHWKAGLLAPQGTTVRLRSITDSYTSGPMFAAQGGAAVTDLADMFMPGQLKLAVTLNVVFEAVYSVPEEGTSTTGGEERP